MNPVLWGLRKAGILEMADRAEADAAQLAPGEGWKSKQDALRHMLLTGQLTQKFGLPVGRGLAAAYEAVPQNLIKNLREPDDAAMDLTNNRIGADLGAVTDDYDSLLAAAILKLRQAKQRPSGIAAAWRDRNSAVPVFLEPGPPAGTR